jgi:putative transposase
VLDLIPAVLAAFRVFFRSRLDTSLEILALRQRVAVLKRKHRRLSLKRLDRFFWTTLRSLWPRWSDVLIIVKPATVIRWHRAGFRLYWRWRSRSYGGRPKVSKEIRTLIRTMATENSHWGAPKIHGELRKLGFEVSNARSRDIFDGRGHIVAIRPNAGCRSSPIIETRSSLSISLPCQL